jgi:integrase/recombinase XerD
MKRTIENNGYLLEEEIPLLLDHLNNKTIRMLAYTLCYSGRRISEALQLKPKDIHQEVGEISWTILKKGGTDLVIKKKAAYPGLIDTLIDYITYNNIDWNDYVFSTPYSLPVGKDAYTRQQVWNIIHKTGIVIGKDIHPHTLRHTYGILLAMNGASFKTIQDQLDHEFASTTQVYLDIAQVHVKQDLAKMKERTIHL